MPHMMLYRSRLHGYTPYAQGLRSSPADWIILLMARNGKLANPCTLFGAMNKFLYLILLIIHAYNTGISWLRLYAQLRSYARFWSEDATPIVCPTQIRRYDSYRTSQLWSHFLTSANITTPVTYHGSGRWSGRVSYHISCERLRMARLDDRNIL
jgi:hypothetical protein